MSWEDCATVSMFIYLVVQSSSQTLRAHPCSIGFHYRKQGLPRWLSGKKSACQCRRLGFDPWVRKICWSGKWQPTPVFLPGKSHGQRSLAGYSPRGHKELDTTEWLTHTHGTSRLSWKIDYPGACEIYWNLPVDGPVKLNGKVSVEVSVKLEGCCCCCCC